MNRFLRARQVWLKQPLVDLADISVRHDIVQSFAEDPTLRERLRNLHLRGGRTCLSLPLPPVPGARVLSTCKIRETDCVENVRALDWGQTQLLADSACRRFAAAGHVCSNCIGMHHHCVMMTVH